MVAILALSLPVDGYGKGVAAVGAGRTSGGGRRSDVRSPLPRVRRQDPGAHMKAERLVAAGAFRSLLTSARFWRPIRLRAGGENTGGERVAEKRTPRDACAVQTE